jgi:hypothetical protein
VDHASHEGVDGGRKIHFNGETPSNSSSKDPLGCALYSVAILSEDGCARGESASSG